MEKATIFDYARMCEGNMSNCGGCPISRHNNGTGIGCGSLLQCHPDKASEIILDWCKEHPVETRQDKLVKAFPNVPLPETSVAVEICPKLIDKNITDCDDKFCKDCCEEYWLAEVEE